MSRYEEPRLAEYVQDDKNLPVIEVPKGCWLLKRSQGVEVHRNRHCLTVRCDFLRKPVCLCGCAVRRTNWRAASTTHLLDIPTRLLDNNEWVPVRLAVLRPVWTCEGCRMVYRSDFSGPPQLQGSLATRRLGRWLVQQQDFDMQQVARICGVSRHTIENIVHLSGKLAKKRVKKTWQEKLGLAKPGNILPDGPQNVDAEAAAVPNLDGLQG